MVLAMCTAGVLTMLAGVRGMSVCRIGVVARLFVIVALMVFCRLHVMAGCMCVVFGSFTMMVGSILGHCHLLLARFRATPCEAHLKVHGQCKVRMTVPI
jgi:hypothetical protein